MEKEERIRQTRTTLHYRLGREFKLPPARKMLVNQAYDTFCKIWEAAKAGNNDWRSFEQEALFFVPDYLEEFGIIMPMRKYLTFRHDEKVEKDNYEHIIKDNDPQTAIEYKKACEENLAQKLDYQKPPLE